MAQGQALPRSAAGDRNPWLIAVIVSIASFMEVLDTTIANVSLRHIAGGLAASQDESTWIVTSYLLSNAIVLPVSGWLANAIGRKRYYMICIAIFTLSSLFCGLSTSLTQIIIARILQGIGGGGLAPTEQSMFVDTFPPEKRGQAFALYGFTVVLAPAIGPVLGGVITDNLSWHWIFFINVPVGLVSLFLVHTFVVEPELLKRERKERISKGFVIDWLGFLLIIAGFGALQIVLDRGERDDGFASPMITACTIIAVVCLGALIPWERRHPQPAIDVTIFKSRNFLAAAITMFMFGFVIISTTQLTPQLTQSLLGYDATDAGLTLGLGGLVTILMMPVAGTTVGKVFQPKWLILASFLGTSYALFHLSNLSLQASFWTLSEARMIQVLFLPFMFVSISAAAYIDLPGNKSNQASAMINLMRNLGGSVGVSIATTLLAWRNQFHHSRLAEHITPQSLQFHNLQSQFHQTPAQALDFVRRQITIQADILSYIDVFRAFGWMVLIVAPLALFMKRIPKGQKAQGH